MVGSKNDTWVPGMPESPNGDREKRSTEPWETKGCPREVRGQESGGGGGGLDGISAAKASRAAASIGGTGPPVPS